MKFTIKAARIKETQETQSLNHLLSHSDDEFYGGLQRVWNRISAVLHPTDGAKAHLGPKSASRIISWRMTNRNPRIGRR